MAYLKPHFCIFEQWHSEIGLKMKVGWEQIRIIRSHVLFLRLVCIVCIFVMSDFSIRHFVACFVMVIGI